MNEKLKCKKCEKEMEIIRKEEAKGMGMQGKKIYITYAECVNENCEDFEKEIGI